MWEITHIFCECSRKLKTTDARWFFGGKGFFFLNWTSFYSEIIDSAFGRYDKTKRIVDWSTPNRRVAAVYFSDAERTRTVRNTRSTCDVGLVLNYTRAISTINITAQINQSRRVRERIFAYDPEPGVLRWFTFTGTAAIRTKYCFVLTLNFREFRFKHLDRCPPPPHQF